MDKQDWLQPITLRISNWERWQLNLLSRRSGETVSAIVRQAIDLYLVSPTARKIREKGKGL